MTTENSYRKMKCFYTVGSRKLFDEFPKAAEQMLFSMVDTIVVKAMQMITDTTSIEVIFF